jgi:phospholipase C
MEETLVHRTQATDSRIASTEPVNHRGFFIAAANNPRTDWSKMVARSLACLLALAVPVLSAAQTSNIKTVWIILMENHNWSQIKGSSSAPYINNTLLPMASHAEQFFNPPGIHPSLPNYLWLEAGTNFGILDDNPPSQDHQSTTQHLVTLLQNKGITWKAYEEDIPGTNCRLNDVNKYAVRHDPFVYFDDVTNNLDPNSANCISHVRPFTELATDLANNTVAQYNFITPNVCDDMHDRCKPIHNPIKQGDTWLSQNLPTILNSAAYRNGGAVFITWDEAATGDGPIGMIVLSQFAKGNGYQNSIHYTHGSTLRTFQEIFNVTPLLGDAANETDLSDLFTVFP